MALLRSLGDPTMRTLMTFDIPELVHKTVAFHKDILLLVCSSLSHSRKDEELSLFPQTIHS